MKKCAVCGNISDDKNTFCGNCGNRLEGIIQEAEVEETGLDIEQIEESAEEALPEEEAPAEEPAAGEEAVEPELVVEETVEEPEAEEAPAEEPAAEEEAAAPETPVLKSEPHIYGQESQDAPQEFAQQGMIRRNVQGRPNDGGQMTYQMNPSLQARPVNMGGNPQGRPMNPQMMQGRPPQGRPMMHNPSQISMQIKDTAKKAMRSPLFFLIALFNTACLCGSVAAVFMNQLNYSQIARMLQEVELPAQVAGYASNVIAGLGALDQGMIIPNLVMLLPNLLLCLGLWGIFFSAIAAKRKDRLAGGGFGLAKAYVIIHMIGACIIMLACLVLSVAVVIATWMSGAKSQMIIAIIVLVVLIVIVMMVIMYYVSFAGSWNVCHVNGNSGDIYGKVSGYVAVIHIIMALFGIVGLLSGIVNNELATIVQSAGRIGWMFFFAIWLFGYKGKMSAFEEE